MMHCGMCVNGGGVCECMEGMHVWFVCVCVYGVLYVYVYGCVHV